MARSAADASVFHAIADPTRRSILELLIEGERTVKAILDAVRMTPSALSQHLAVLLRAGLVHQRRDGRHRLYRVAPEPLFEVSQWIGQFDRFWSQRLDNLGRYLQSSQRKGKR